MRPNFTWGVANDGGQDYLTLTFVADLRADDITITAQRTTDLTQAWGNSVVEISRIPNTATGFATITFRSAVPYSGSTAEFMRILVTKP